MEGKRVAQVEAGTQQKRPHRAAWIMIAVVAALLIGGTVGLCVYAGSYSGVFPGVTMAGVPLSGQDPAQAEASLAAALPDWIDRDAVSITADGEDLGVYELSQLGAYAVPGEAAQAAYAVGRESGVLGWLKNGWTMARCLLGNETELTPAVYYNEEALGGMVRAVAAKFDKEPLDASYQLSREGLFATKHQDGRALDQAALADALMRGQEAVDAQWEVAPAKPLDVEALSQTLSAEASPARYDIEQGKVVDGQVGVSLDTEAVAYVMEAAAQGETVQLPAEIVYPEMTAQELEEVLFRDLLGTCTTDVSGTSARKGNVKLAGACVNGTILNDGDIFDYNQVVGQRTTERGFGEAATYVNGETINTVGGGICQVSSTIYKATLLSNLEIVERYAHRFYPGYIDLGMDATVSWGGPEFRFKNNTGFPIRVDVSYANSQLTVSIYGTKTDASYVKMTREVLSTTGYETEYVETDELPYGTQKQKQNGYTGYEVKSYRNLYDGNGNLISSTLEAKSSYKSRNRIILVGTAGRPASPIDPTDPTPPPDGGSDPGNASGGGEPVLPPDESVSAGGDVDTEPPGWLNP